MAVSEAERFINDVTKNKQLGDRLKPHASGLAALAAGAKTHGYDFTVDELKQAMRAKAKQNLNDAQLDAIAGGTGGGSLPPVMTNIEAQANVASQVSAVLTDFAVVQTAAVVTQVAMGT